ncbi:MAG: DUF485 domain-containing protein [Magnetococcales bacterium]|nr:DUF485 domain-containing protein [Magnetococcales bacterium]
MDHSGELDASQIARIRNNPKYKELVSKRSRFAWNLSFIMLFLYYAFILVIAFKPALLGIPIMAGSVISWGIPIGAGLIVAAFLLTGVYVRRANSEYDELTRQLKEEFK